MFDTLSAFVFDVKQHQAPILKAVDRTTASLMQQFMQHRDEKQAKPPQATTSHMQHHQEQHAKPAHITPG